MNKDVIYNAVMRNSDMYNELAESMKLPIYIIECSGTIRVSSAKTSVTL